MPFGAGSRWSLVEVSVVSRHAASLLLACAALLGACSSGNGDPSGPTKASGPCDLLRPDDAADLLGGKVERIDFSDALAPSTSVPAEDQAQVDAAAERICMYRAEEGEATVALQLDRALFENEAEFRNAFGSDVEPLNDPGLAASYQNSGEGGVTHMGVLLNEEGDSFDLRVSGETTTKDEMKRVASAITDRY